MGNMSISQLFSKLMVAIRNRGKFDPSFSLLDHLRDPRGYSPKSPDESACWDELTHPNRHDELVAFVDERSRKELNWYASFFDALLLKASNERLSRSSGESRQT
jgi:hypothetical protein